MKCKVCGRELDPQKSYCDKCGTPVGMNSTTSEFSWNTIDFPKPKAIHDIDMQWGEMSKPIQKSTADLSEGFVVHKQAEPKRQAQQVYVSSQPEKIQPQQAPQPQQATPAMPQTVQYVQAPLTWTMSSSAWSMPQTQQVVIPQPYNVQPSVIQTAPPVISAMPQMPTPQVYTQPMYVTQPMPLVQVMQAQPTVQAQAPISVQPSVSVQAPVSVQPVMSAQPSANIQEAMPVQSTLSVQQTAPAQAPVETRRPAQNAVLNQTQPSDSIDYKKAYSNAIEHTIDPRVNSMPVAPAAIKHPINVDSWLDSQLESATSVSDDKFFTFHKKNEDFQKLLDEEYQRYKDKYDTNAESLKQSQILSAAQINKAAREAVKISATDDVRKADRSSKDFDKKLPSETMMFSGEEFHKPFEKAKEKDQAKSNDFFEGEPVTEFDKMLEEGTTNVDELGDGTLAISNAQLRKEINDVAKKVEEAYGRTPVKIGTSQDKEFDVSKLEAYDKDKRKQQLESMASARDSFFNQEEEPQDQSKVNAQELKSIFDEWDKERQEATEKKPRKKHRFGKFLLTIIFLIALFAAIDMTFIKFLPNNTVTEFFENVNYKALELYGQITGKELVKSEENPSEMTAQEKVANQVNKNIEKITYDVESSKYVSTGEYGISNLGSKTVETDEDIICELTKVIVGYNSSWVDYVNEGEDISCFDYLKTDGEAFRAASNFNRLGKQEQYKKLNIGEIRKDSNYYYVFCSELIRVSVGNSVSDTASNIIYKLTLVGDVYKIVEYDSYS